jgi:3-hydroxybutyryl-CoA dehydrogenase
LTLVAPLGFDVTTVAVVERLDPARTVGIDMLIDDKATKRRVMATNPATRDGHARCRARTPCTRRQACERDPGQRRLCLAAGGCHHRQHRQSTFASSSICTPNDLETAVTLGLGYPLGPLAMGDRYGPANVLEVLFNMQTVYGDPRYRPSPWLRRSGAIGLSLLHREA